MVFVKRLSLWFRKIGPGFITGAADDDPSGIATYSVAGARYGYQMNWLTLFLIPAMISIQEMCGQIGLVTGRGLAGIVKVHYKKQLLWFLVSLLLVANVINIGADLMMMGAVAEMILGGARWVWILVIAIAIVAMEILVPYKRYVGVLKWLALLLLVYPITALLVKQDWAAILGSTIIPSISFDKDYLLTMVGFLGTTISPYLFFWQTSEEVEEEILEHKIGDFGGKPRVSMSLVRGMAWDTKVGMIFSNLMTFFIILTTAATLHQAGVFNLTSPSEVAMSLRPLAGNFAYFLFALGVIGIGLQAIPVLAGSIGYALAETIGIKEGLGKKFSRARGFYTIVALATVVGVLMNFTNINPINALLYSAVINGVLSLPMIAVILKISTSRKIMGEYRVRGVKVVVALVALILMSVASGLLVWSLF